MSFLDAFLLLSPVKLDRDGGLFEKLFKEKKLALLGGLAMGTAFLEGVDTASAAVVAAPLFATALFGKEGTQRIIKAARGQALDIITSVYGYANKAVQSVAKDTALGKLFEAPLHLVQMLRTGATGDLKDFTDAVKNSFDSFLKLRDEFGKGKISFKEMFTKGVPKGQMDLFSEIDKQTTTNFGTTFGEMFSHVQGVFDKWMAGLRVAWAINGPVPAISHSMRNVPGIFKDVWSAITDITQSFFNKLNRDVKKWKAALLGILALLVASAASAGTLTESLSSGFSDLTRNTTAWVS